MIISNGVVPLETREKTKNHENEKNNKNEGMLIENVV